ncbi:hypothetical protein HMPREF3069_29575 [Achromobacter xylosoxidans]|uniref:hypothetical protein n=2 Tax=Alcaligenes xylosoxydans xylosoxydans TaxID=85698 RepID=UPI0006C05CB2|nr:hypothetical protein [Achromobacter xylosoxidans]OFL44356.1 hypothetical protein HMPREF2772_11650 [Achromobacter xylosoxidans]OFS31089.1 hypothetical protein HMPREF3069_29575 [Achromobacter xylosoxidans]CUI46955.1 Uncharacterised protein [Achromobacter xylosoxidans]
MRTWLERMQGWLLLAGIFLGTLVGVFYRGRATGRQAERQERNEQINEQAAKARQEMRDVQDEVARQDDAVVADRLKSGWVRSAAGKGRR